MQFSISACSIGDGHLHFIHRHSGRGFRALAATCVALCWNAWRGETVPLPFETALKPFLAEHCIRCHSPEKKKGKIDLTGLNGNVEQSPEVWAKVLEQLTDRSMPPEDEKQPEPLVVDKTIAWISAKLPASARPSATRSLPRGGNLIPHEKLFTKKRSSQSPRSAGARVAVSFANFGTKKNKLTRTDDPVPADVVPKPDPNAKKAPEWLAGVDKVYGFDEWPSPQPAEVPKGTRLGVLMQPSWLVAYSTNFDNDPVRRGRWIRERLLGGTVPELPIGVAAQVPDEPHRTFRNRLTVTRAEQCWKCHRQMDELGLPFEDFDHYGRFRMTETVRDSDATAKNVDKKGKPLGPVTRETDLNTSGKIAISGDPTLDGEIKDPRELVLKLAASERVRQVFIRHAFRFYMGRNETLGDAKTLQDADRAYVGSGGSFKALLISLLTSDSFLYCSDVKPAEGVSK